MSVCDANVSYIHLYQSLPVWTIKQNRYKPFNHVTKTEQHCGAHTYTFNVGWTVASSGLHRNVVIFLKINSGVAPREQFTRGGKNRFKNLGQTKWWKDCISVLLFLISITLTVPGARWVQWAWTNLHHLWNPPPSGCFLRHWSPHAHIYTCTQGEKFISSLIKVIKNTAFTITPAHYSPSPGACAAVIEEGRLAPVRAPPKAVVGSISRRSSPATIFVVITTKPWRGTHQQTVN